MKSLWAGCTCFFLSFFVLIWHAFMSTGVLSIGDIGNAKNPDHQQLPEQNITISTNVSLNGDTNKEAGNTDTAIPKVLNEDDIIIDMIKPTVAPATPQDELGTTIVGVIPETVSSEIKPSLQKRSMLHALDATESIIHLEKSQDVLESSTNKAKAAENILREDSGTDRSQKQEVATDTKSASSESASTEFTLNNETDTVTIVVKDEGKESQSQPVPPKLNDAPVLKDEGIEKEKADEKLETFAEWREKQELKSQDGDTQAAPKVKTRKITTRKQVNYASADCGAKVVSANVDATNLAAMLNENKDIYMLSPCKSKTWFIVELCEKIQIELIEIANYELFSSTPENFNVYLSSRNPSRDWQLLGTFHGRDERKIQGFALEEKHYAKFVKVEMLSHFGNEHYCPVSLFRVFGTSEVDEIEESEGSDNDNDQNDAENSDIVLPSDPRATSQDDRSPNFIESAKDAVFGMVSKAVESLTKNTGTNSTKDNTENVASKEVPKNTTSDTEHETINTTSVLSSLNTSHSPETVEVNSSIVELMKDESEDDGTDASSLNFSICIFKGDLSNRTCANPLTTTYFFFVLGQKKCPKFKINHVRKGRRRVGIALPSTNKKTLPKDDPTGVVDNLSIVKSVMDASSDRKSTATPKVENRVSQENMKLSESEIAPVASVGGAASSVKDVPIIVKLESSDNGTIFKSKQTSNTVTTSAKEPGSVVGDKPAIHNVIEPTISSHDTPSPVLMNDKAMPSGSQIKPTLVVSSNGAPHTKPSVTNEGTSSKNVEDVDVLEFTGYDNNNREGRAEKILSNGSGNVSTSIGALNASTSGIPDNESQTMISSKSQEDTKKVEISSQSEATKKAAIQDSITTSVSKDAKATVDYVDVKSSAASSVSTPTIEVAKTTKLPHVASAVTTTADVSVEVSPTPSDKDLQLTPFVTEKIAEPLKMSKPASLEGDLTSKPNTAKSASECTGNGWSSTVPAGASGASGGTKESLLVKLRGRVKALETNLTLSNQYLEQMSRRYKAAMEEQKKTFEKKLSSLNQSVIKAENQIIDYEKRNQELMKTISTLNKNMETIKKSIQTQNEQIAENYAFLIFVQIAVTMVLIWACRPRRRPQLTTSIGERRRSEPSIHYNDAGNLSPMPLGMPRTALTTDQSLRENIQQSKTLFGFGAANKKKRQKRKTKSFECNTNLDTSKTSSTMLNRTAGLLFSAGKGILCGIAGAFSPSYTSKAPLSASRNADALIDPFKESFSHTVRRSRSSDLPVIEEDDRDILPERPRSCDDLLLARKPALNGNVFTFNKRSGKQSG